MPVRALNGKHLRLVEVIAQILGYLKRELIDNHLRKAGYHFTAEDFDWVVTVPAIWLASGKQMMRLASVMVRGGGGRGRKGVYTDTDVTTSVL